LSPHDTQRDGPLCTRWFCKAIDLNPTWIGGNIKLGMAYSRMGEHDKAMACVRRAGELMGGAHGTPLSQTWLAASTHCVEGIAYQ